MLLQSGRENRLLKSGREIQTRVDKLL